MFLFCLGVLALSQIIGLLLACCAIRTRVAQVTAILAIDLLAAVGETARLMFAERACGGWAPYQGVRVRRAKKLIPVELKPRRALEVKNCSRFIPGIRYERTSP